MRYSVVVMQKNTSATMGSLTSSLYYRRSLGLTEAVNGEAIAAYQRASAGPIDGPVPTATYRRCRLELKMTPVLFNALRRLAPEDQFPF